MLGVRQHSACAVQRVCNHGLIRLTCLCVYVSVTSQHLLTAMLSHDPRARPHPLELRAMLQLCLQQTEYEIMQETLMQQQYDTAYYQDMGAHTQMLEAY